MNRLQLERYTKKFLNHFEEYIIAAEFDSEQNLIVFASPYHNFDKMLIEICEGLTEIIGFPNNLILYVYPFGSNEPARIAINPLN